MASNKYVYQQVHNVSINRESLQEIASNDSLSKKDYKVLICLFTQLDGWAPNKDFTNKDPQNFKIIDTKMIADVLGMDKKDVKKSIRKLMDEYIVEKGSSDTIKTGYRFTF